MEPDPQPQSILNRIHNSVYTVLTLGQQPYETVIKGTLSREKFSNWDCGGLG